MMPDSVGHSWKAGIIIFDTLQTPCCELHPGVPPNAYNTDRGSLIHELCALRPRDRERLMITSLGRERRSVSNRTGAISLEAVRVCHAEGSLRPCLDDGVGCRAGRLRPGLRSGADVLPRCNRGV